VAKAYSLLGGYRHSYDNKIATGGFISSRDLPRGDFQTGYFISWHLLNLAACLAAMDEWDDLRLQ